MTTSLTGERVPLLAEQPVGSLGRLYEADLCDTHLPATIRLQLIAGLERIDKSHLQGNSESGAVNLPSFSA